MWDKLKGIGIILGGLLIILILISTFILPARAQVTSITLDWTAPGDDGNVGTATSYQGRWSTVRPDTTSTTAMDTWWNGATVITGLPTPTLAGTTQSVVVAGSFNPNTYYFVIRAADEVPNFSGYSNLAIKVITDTFAPARILDLRTR